MVVKRFMKTNKVLLSFIGSALLLSGQASASDIQPPVDNGSAMISRDEAAQRVGVSLTQNGWNDTKALQGKRTVKSLLTRHVKKRAVQHSAVIIRMTTNVRVRLPRTAFSRVMKPLSKVRRAISLP